MPYSYPKCVQVINASQPHGKPHRETEPDAPEGMARRAENAEYQGNCKQEI
jgi:hypothetical protein